MWWPQGAVYSMRVAFVRRWRPSKARCGFTRRVACCDPAVRVVMLMAGARGSWRGSQLAAERATGGPPGCLEAQSGPHGNQGFTVLWQDASTAAIWACRHRLAVAVAMTASRPHACGTAETHPGSSSWRLRAGATSACSADHVRVS